MPCNADRSPPATGTDSHPRVPRKRKRRTFACTICHRRKLKCDQTFPSCRRCIKSGAECIYTDSNLDHPGRSCRSSTADEPITPNDSKEYHHKVGGSRVLRHFTSPARSTTFASAGEARKPRTFVSARDITVASNIALSNSRPEPETFLFKGHGFATQYYGPTHPTSAMLHIPLLQSFIIIGQRTAFATFPRLYTDFKTLQNSMRSFTEVSIFAMIPDKHIARLFAEQYFERFELMYRVLHGPTFWEHFDRKIIWQSLDQSDATFSVVLLLVMLIAKTIAPFEWSTNSGSNLDFLQPPPEAVINTCKRWLASQTRKHLTIELFQIRILIHVAEQTNCVQLKQTWASAGSLLRFAMGAGLHRDPTSLHGPISPYYQQMRRVLWFTIVELELQASLDRGVSSSLCGQPWDCGAAKNLDDKTYDIESSTLPDPKKDQDFTDLSYLYLLHRSVRLRTELCFILNNNTSSLTHDQVLNYEDQIKALLEDLPAWNHEKGQAVKTMVEMQCRQYLLLLHCRFLQQSISRPRQRYSTFLCITEATSILQGYNRLQTSGDNAHAMLSIGGILRPSISLCYAMTTFSGSLDGHVSIETVNKGLECALSVLEGNVIRNARGLKEYWHLSATHSYTMSHFTMMDQRKAELEREAWERVIRLFYRVTATRKNGVILNGIPSPTETLGPSTEHVHNSSVDTLAPIPDPTPHPPPLMDFIGFPMPELWAEPPDILQWDFNENWDMGFEFPDACEIY